MEKSYFVTVGERGGITLPSQLREYLKIEAGSLLRVSVTSEEKLVIEPGYFLARTADTLGAEKAMVAAAEKSERTTPTIEGVVSEYEKLAKEGFAVSHQLQTYAQIFPQGWPLSVHYEFISSRNGIDAEIHLEKAEVRPLAKPLSAMEQSLAKEFTGGTVKWSPGWRGIGRLRVVLGADSTNHSIALAMLSLIEKTFEPINKLVQGLPNKSTT
jgi:AbrB family looped-hinge helix DNA binding protein